MIEMKLRNSVALVVVGLSVLSAGTAWAGAPTIQLKDSVDGILMLLNRSTTTRNPVAARRAAIRRVVDHIFDFNETARRALGLHWQALTRPEQEEFTRLFSELLIRSYLSRIERYRGETIAYIGEAVDGDYATVRTNILTKEGNEIPVEYFMRQRGSQWLVYDVSIERVSLISNYRSQFNNIIETSSYQELVRKIKEKLGAQDSAEKRPSRPPTHDAGDFRDLAERMN